MGPACDFASIIASVSATDPNTVIAQFSVGGAPLVTEAARGYVVPGAVSSATAEQTLGTWDSAANTGSSGVVFGVPTLLSTSTTNVSPIPIGGIFLGSAPCQGPPNTAQTQ